MGLAGEEEEEEEEEEGEEEVGAAEDKDGTGASGAGCADLEESSAGIGAAGRGASPDTASTATTAATNTAAPAAPMAIAEAIPFSVISAATGAMPASFATRAAERARCAADIGLAALACSSSARAPGGALPSGSSHRLGSLMRHRSSPPA